jgi:hypothetical protein
LSENNTNLKASIAAVVYSILDLKAKEMGLFSDSVVRGFTYNAKSSVTNLIVAIQWDAKMEVTLATIFYFKKDDIENLFLTMNPNAIKIIFLVCKKC